MSVQILKSVAECLLNLNIVITTIKLLKILITTIRTQITEVIEIYYENKKNVIEIID